MANKILITNHPRPYQFNLNKYNLRDDTKYNVSITDILPELNQKIYVHKKRGVVYNDISAVDEKNCKCGESWEIISSLPSDIPVLKVIYYIDDLDAGYTLQQFSEFFLNLSINIRKIIIIIAEGNNSDYHIINEDIKIFKKNIKLNHNCKIYIIHKFYTIQ